MSQSFEIVEDKLSEAEFFLERMRSVNRFASEGRYYFSAFVSAARSVTFVLQTTMGGVEGFKAWYESARTRLKVDPLSRYLVEIRNDVVHKGTNPLNRATLEHLPEDISRQLHQKDYTHILIVPDPSNDSETALVNAVEVCSDYFTSVVVLIFECYERFKYQVDPRWYFTRENFIRMGKTFEDAVQEFGFPQSWATCAPDEPFCWRALRSQEPSCQIDRIFHAYIGKTIAGPDDAPGTDNRSE